jgi:hypothetical protein
MQSEAMKHSDLCMPSRISLTHLEIATIATSNPSFDRNYVDAGPWKTYISAIRMSVLCWL